MNAILNVKTNCDFCGGLIDHNLQCPYCHKEQEVIVEVCKFCNSKVNDHGVCTRCPETGEEDEPVAQCGCCGEWTEECNMREGMCSYCFSVNVGE